MKKIIHISDLHFGTEDHNIVDVLANNISHHEPDLVVISGDLTQRAKIEQFERAAEFLNNIKYPKIVVPGNHDISLYNLIRRFFKPLKRFQKFVDGEQFPEYEDESLLVVGMNSSRSLTIQNGRVSRKQISYLRKRFAKAKGSKLKILVVHHNILPVKGAKFSKAVGRSSLLVEFVQECSIHVILSGHLHKGYSVASGENLNSDHNFIFIQAGTATSSRLREDKNSYNLIKYDNDLILYIYEFNGHDFECVRNQKYKI